MFPNSHVFGTPSEQEGALSVSLLHLRCVSESCICFLSPHPALALHRGVAFLRSIPVGLAHEEAGVLCLGLCVQPLLHCSRLGTHSLRMTFLKYGLDFQI